MKPKLKKHNPKKKRGRPSVLVMPDPIPDTPENIARACMHKPRLRCTGTSSSLTHPPADQLGLSLWLG